MPDQIISELENVFSYHVLLAEVYEAKINLAKLLLESLNFERGFVQRMISLAEYDPEQVRFLVVAHKRSALGAKALTRLGKSVKSYAAEVKAATGKFRLKHP